MEIRRPDFPPRSGLRLDFRLHRHEADIRITQENQPKDGGRIFGWLEGSIGPELIGDVPELFFEFGVGVVGGGGLSPMHEMQQASQPEEWRKKEVGFPFQPMQPDNVLNLGKVF
jgi:hypothetical protein